MYQNRHEENKWSWTQIPLKHSDKPLTKPTVLLFDHYLMIKLHYNEREDDAKQEDVYSNPRKPVVLLIVDLSDDSVQEVEVKDKSWLFDQWRFTEAPYSLTKYKEDQIVKFGRTEDGQTVMSLITIESFKPFVMKSEEIVSDGAPDLSRHTAQIHDGLLYVFGGRENDLWRFDLSKKTENRKWELLKTTGKCPKGISEPLSFVFGDNLYIHEQRHLNDDRQNQLFMLNLQSMSWAEFEKPPNLGREQLDKSIYKSNLIFFNEHPLDSKGDYQKVLWDWEIARIEKYKCFRPRMSDFNKTPRDLTGSSIVYYNYLMAFTLSKALEGGFDFSMFVVNLDNLERDRSMWGNAQYVESPEESKLRALYAKSKFLMPKDAEVVLFRVQDKQIPVHKQVIERSRYFARFLKESELTGFIDFPDCDEVTFRKFLQFLYCKEVSWEIYYENADDDDDSVLKLLMLADKTQQYGLRDKCIEFLKRKVTSGNIFRLYDFVCERRIPRFKEDFNRLLMKNIAVDNISRVVQYLENQAISPQDLLEMKAQAITVLLSNFGEDLGLYKDFLLKSIEIDTILLFSQLVYFQETEEENDNFDLRLALLDFGRKNFQEIKSGGFVQHLPKMFLADLVSSVL